MSTLIAAYTFNESAAHDYSGNKYHLTNSGVTFSPTTSSGFGMDAVFTGSASLTAASFPSFASLTGFTCFFNIYATNNNYAISVVSAAYEIQLSSTNNIIFTITDSTNTTHTLTSTATITTSTWATVGCVWDGSYMYIYINGALDSTLSVSFSNIGAGTGGIAVGSTVMTGLLNMFELRNSAMNASQILSLNNSPGGVECVADIHNFVVGDLIADCDVVSQGVVTWVVDQSTFMFYPLTSVFIQPMSKYGNIYVTARQNIMEISNDFDGNGSSQISVKYPIASFSDYSSPGNKITLDYNGLSGSPDSIANMMAITSLRI